MNADSNQGFAASPRQLGLGEKRIRLLAAAEATDRLEKEERLHIHEGGVHGPVQILLVDQDAVDVLHCGSAQNGCWDQNIAMRVQC